MLLPILSLSDLKIQHDGYPVVLNALLKKKTAVEYSKTLGPVSSPKHSPWPGKQHEVKKRWEEVVS